MILGTPVVAITILLLAFERLARVGIFDPALGGDPVLFQHLFWFYSHPAVYIMVLPAMGVISELIANFSRKNIFGYTFRRLFESGDCRVWFPGLGPPPVCARASRLRRDDLLVSEFCGGDSVGDQGLQLDGHALQRSSISYDTPMLYALGLSDCSRSAA